MWHIRQPSNRTAGVAQVLEHDLVDARKEDRSLGPETFHRCDTWQSGIKHQTMGTHFSNHQSQNGDSLLNQLL